MTKEIDVEYLTEIIKQIKCKNNGMIHEVNKKGFKGITGVMINDNNLSLEYLQEKTTMIDMLLHTIEKDIIGN